MPLQATSGAASYDGFGGGVVAEPNYIEQIFQTYLYTGNASTQTITNGIDLAGKGGMVWTKNRSAANSHYLWDTARGNTKRLSTDSDAAEGTTAGVFQFNSNGFSDGLITASGNNIASWTFRKQPKFFDVVTYTGNGVAGRTVAHNLGSVPGCMFVKCLDTIGTSWYGYHRSLGATYRIILEQTSAASVSSLGWNNTEPTSTEFTVSANGNVNGNGKTYVAYLFAHNAGGFGLTGTDNVISCGGFTADGSGNATISLGYEPQWLLCKLSSGVDDWIIVDNMRGWTATGGGNALRPNLSNAEAANYASWNPTATGFYNYSAGSFVAGGSYIYIAIRRGPMKVPTSGTSVFSPVARTGTGANVTVSSGFPTDSALTYNRGGTNPIIASRLTNTGYLATPSTAAEVAGGTTIYQANPWDVMSGIKLGTTSALTNQSSGSFINYFFQRAPSFFDEVCYTGNNNGTGQTLSHNLAAVPELMIVKRRGGISSWLVYSAAIGATNYLMLNDTAASAAASTVWQNTAPTATQFTIGQTPNQADTYVAYLFATCAGVSKVGSYTGTGTTLQVNCGFTGGARFVLIKRTDSTGDWYVWDSARGIVSGNDPYFRLNSAAAEVTNTDYVDTYSAGFEISSTAPAAINANGGTFIFLAIA